MKKLGTLLSVAAVAVICTPAFAAHLDNPNLLADPGFEVPLTFDGPNFRGSWEGFNSGDGTAENTTAMPRNGAQALELNVNSANQFSGAFQDVVVPAGSAGANWWFSGWHKLGSGQDGGSEVRIEWRDANGEIARTNLPTPTVTSEYTEFVLSDVVPAGAITARAVYALASFVPTVDTAQVFVDDVNFNIAGVPEPTSLLLLGMGGCALLGARRRR